MKKLLLPALALLFLTLSSLANKKANPFTPGTYGVSDCIGTASATEPMIELTFNADNTFTYVDNTDPDKKLNLNGNWENKKGKILLTNYKCDWAIHHTWTVDDNQKCIKSRCGLNWLRICLVKGCGS